MRKPIIIRRVTKMGRDGRPKVARDRRALITMERVTAQSDKGCAYYKCEQIILAGDEYAKLTSPLHGKRVGLRYVPDPKNYHFGRVPPEAWPLLRFFKFPETPTDKTT